jgi:anti-anti-sigma regulatory factor
MTPVKINKIQTLLKGLLDNHEQTSLGETDSNHVFISDSNESQNIPLIPGLNRTASQEDLIEIGPRLDIQTGIDLLEWFKNITQPIKAIRIDLQGALTTHGAVIQTLLVIHESCKVSGTLFAISGVSSELLSFFHLVGLDYLVVETMGVES